MRALWTVTFTALLVGCQSTQSPSATPTTAQDGLLTYIGSAIRFQYPSSVSVTRDLKSGFIVYYLKNKSSAVTMGIYEGQRPKSFSPNDKQLTVTRRVNSERPPDILKANDQWGRDAKGKYWRESIWECQQLLTLKTGKIIPFPITLHFWYFGATEAESDGFEAIIQTLSLNHSQQPKE